jgi:hypothetical protein
MGEEKAKERKTKQKCCALRLPTDENHSFPGRLTQFARYNSQFIQLEGINQFVCMLMEASEVYELIIFPDAGVFSRVK